MSRCPNEVNKENLIDQLRWTGGFWKEQRRRHLERSMRHAAIIKAELDKLNETELDKLEEFQTNETGENTNQN